MSSPNLPAASVLASKIDLVTFFEDRAEVRRVVRCRVAAGSSLLSLPGVSLSLDDSSLQAVVRGGQARVVAASVSRGVRPQGAPAAEITAREAEHRAARKRLFDAQRAFERADAEQDRLKATLESWEQAVARAPRVVDDAAAKLRVAIDELNKALTESFERVLRCRHDLERAVDVDQLASARLASARVVTPRHEATLELQIASPADGELELDITYRTPCALWRPEHLAQLTPATPQAPARLSLRTYASAWQCTGEDWKGVRCRFSTARPAQAASPPHIEDDVLSLQRKADPRSVIIEEREQNISAVSLGRGARRVDEMPGVDDGGEPLWFEARAPATVPSDGAPVPVELDEVSLPCEVDLVAFPERGEAAWVRATATWTGKTPLLSGPVRASVGGTMVGLSQTRFVAPGEPFELGFGHDDDVRVLRSIEEKRETVPVIGTQKISRRLRLYVSNLGRGARPLKVVERVPVSEIRDVTVEVTEAGGARVDRDGFARFELVLAPGQHLELALAYRLEASSRVEM